MWELLPPDTKEECATQDCPDAARWRFEVGGVGSYYCQCCKEGIEGQREADREAALAQLP